MWKDLSGLGTREQKIGERLPYDHLVNGHTLRLRDGGLMQVIYLEGFSFETADTLDLNTLHSLRDNAFRAIGDSRLIVHHHILRRRVSVTPEGTFDDPVTTLIDERWRERLASRALFVNDLFLTLVRRPAKGKAGLAEAISRLFGAQSGDESLETALRDLDAARDALMAALTRYGPRRLGTYSLNGGTGSEPLEFLSALLHGEMRPIQQPSPLAAEDLGHALPQQRLSFGLRAYELQGAGAEKQFGTLISVKDYPPQVGPGVLDALLHLPFELTVSQSFQYVDRQIGLERVNLALRRLRAADDDSQTLRAGLMAAKDELTAGLMSLGEHHLSVNIRADDLDRLDQAAAQALSALADTGAVAVREDINAEPAFWAQFPGNEAFIARRALISVSALASLTSLHGFALGQASGNHWGEAVTVLETTAATPYFFNFHAADLGNFTLIGPTGSGKTVVLNFLAAQAQKIRPRTILFDKDRGSELFIRAIGGTYTALRPGEPSGFNPLQLPDTPSNRTFLRDLILTLVSPDGYDATEEVVVTEALDAMYAQDPALRRLRHFRELLSGHARPHQADLAARLAPWCDQGEAAWLFDQADDTLDLSARIVGFDMTRFLDAPRLRTPIMMYLFHRIEERLDGSPAMILIDEGWKALDDTVFAARIRDWMKTLRKRNAILGFGTQSAGDALGSRISAAIIEQAATQIFMPNPRARSEDYCDGFGLSAHELSLIRTLPVNSRAFLIKHGHEAVVVRLDLSDSPDLLTILSGRESTVRRLDALRETHGDSPSQWWAALTGTQWPGDAVPDRPRHRGQG
ncbi:MAG: VirB4 family type IV secretion/conjugal transfer ATPase [Asticcacaulis sp.]